MWALRNDTPYAAERTFVRDPDGAERLLVAVRATFELLDDGTPRPAAVQQPVVQAPLFSGDPLASSLIYDSDLPRTKPGTDILLHASAWAPGGVPAPTVAVLMQVGQVEKRLLVHGARHWAPGPLGFGLVPGAPTPFLQRPIRYEDALGGPLGPQSDAPRDPANPCGIGRIALAGAPAPSIEHPQAPVRTPVAALPPAGFGPLAAHWHPRRALAGTCDATWQQTRAPLLPADFDDRYFYSAPPDQCVPGFLNGGERVLLRHLNPAGEWRFQLPRLRFGFSTRIGGRTVQHRGDLHSIIIEPDARRLVMVWHSALPCQHTLYQLRETLVFEKTWQPRPAAAGQPARPQARA